MSAEGSFLHVTTLDVNDYMDDHVEYGDICPDEQWGPYGNSENINDIIHEWMVSLERFEAFKATNFSLLANACLSGNYNLFIQQLQKHPINNFNKYFEFFEDESTCRSTPKYSFFISMIGRKNYYLIRQHVHYILSMSTF